MRNRSAASPASAARPIAARTYAKLIGLMGSVGGEGKPPVSGYAWDSGQARLWVEEIPGQKVTLFRHEGPERFDALPLRANLVIVA